jgi:YebC/PmpR family DNA-binding regulatory protein
MSGHNKYSQIKDRKAAQDSKKSVLYTKMLALVAVAAKQNPNPDNNPRLRTTIYRAKEAKVPIDNIERAISKASETKDLEDVLIEAYGPESVGILIEAITDNSNRTISEIRHLLDENGAKMATPGSVQWSFEKANNVWSPKFPQPTSEAAKKLLQELITKIEEHPDVQCVVTNSQ